MGHCSPSLHPRNFLLRRRQTRPLILRYLSGQERRATDPALPADSFPPRPAARGGGSRPAESCDRANRCCGARALIASARTPGLADHEWKGELCLHERIYLPLAVFHKTIAREDSTDLPIHDSFSVPELVPLQMDSELPLVPAIRAKSIRPSGARWRVQRSEASAPARCARHPREKRRSYRLPRTPQGQRRSDLQVSRQVPEDRAT